MKSSKSSRYTKFLNDGPTATADNSTSADTKRFNVPIRSEK